MCVFQSTTCSHTCRCAEGSSKQQLEMEAMLLSLQNCDQPRLITEDAQVMKILLHDIFSIKQDNQNQHTKVLEVGE